MNNYVIKLNTIRYATYPYSTITHYYYSLPKAKEQTSYQFPRKFRL
jgi:hypothetical protein